MVENGRTAKDGRDRASERGAAIFIVVAVLTLLSAIGIFAARAATLAEQASGYDRQNTQNHYVSEYALMAAATELGGPRAGRYVRLLMPPMLTTARERDAW